MRTRPVILILMFIAAMAVSIAARADEVRHRVLVLPFEEISANPSQDWIGQAVSHSLVAELSQMPQLQPTAGTLAISQADRALRAARDANAAYVVIGGYQLLDPQLRITGQVIEVASGEVIGGLKATGTVRDLFGMQDTLAAQAKRIVRQRLSPPQPSEAATTPQPAPPAHRPIEASGPLRVGQYHGSSLQRAVQTGSVDARPAYAYDPGYTNYTYGYGYPYVYGQPYAGGYYGMPLYWGYPPPLRSGYWPVVPGYGHWFWHRHVIIKTHPRKHDHHSGKHHGGSRHISGTSVVIRAER